MSLGLLWGFIGKGHAGPWETGSLRDLTIALYHLLCVFLWCLCLVCQLPSWVSSTGSTCFIHRDTCVCLFSIISERHWVGTSVEARATPLSDCLFLRQSHIPVEFLKYSWSWVLPPEISQGCLCHVARENQAVFRAGFLFIPPLCT